MPYTYEVKRKDAAGVTRTVKMAGQCALEDPVGKLTVAALKACFAALDRVAVVQRTPPTGNKNDLKALLQERRLAERTRRRLTLDFGALRIGISRRSLFFEPASYCAFLGTLPCTNEVGLFLARSAPSRREHRVLS